MAPTSPVTPNRARMSVSRRYQETNHLIPTPSEFQKSQRYNPIALWLPVVVGTPMMMLGLAIALEVGVGISQKNAGFAVPVKNLIPQASQQFLLSFFPTVFVIPVAFLWRELDYFLRWYQPYVLLSKGNVKAEESLLMDYVSAGPFWSILYGFRFKHWLVFFSAYTAVFTYLLQPLAGSIFQIQQRDKPTTSTVQITTAIGLNDATIADNTAFVASAGFVQTAVFNGLNDPPFIQGGWTTTEFDFPTYEGFNGSMSVNTTGIKSIVNCANPTARPAITQDSNQTIITATSAEGCSVKVNLTAESSTQQYGVVDTGGCSGIGDAQKRPVMFWFYHDKDDGSQEARAVFCAPTLQANIVEASANLANGNMTTVHAIAPFETANNVTGAPLNGQAFNGVVFNNSQNPFIQARASATNNGVPGAIFRLASQAKSGLQSVFDDDSGFLNRTIQVYTQHLALSAKGIYFVPIVQTTLPSQQTSSVPRLVINPIAAHTLAFFMLIIGAAGLFVQILFRRKRNTLLLAAPPGSIAAVTALTAHSGFGQLLFPYDNMETLNKKLEGFRFRMDQRTGAIIVDDSMDEESTTTDRGVRQSLLPPSEKLTPGQTPMEMTSTTSLLPETSYFGGRVPTEYQPTPLVTPSNES